MLLSDRKCEINVAISLDGRTRDRTFSPHYCVDSTSLNIYLSMHSIINNKNILSLFSLTVLRQLQSYLLKIY